MKNSQQTLPANKTSPFIGHAGIGARIEVIKKNNVLVLRETIKSQLGLIFTLGITSLYPAWILVFAGNKINGGIFGKFLLGVLVLMTFPYFVKHSVRLLRQRRIEIDILRQQILFISEKMKTETSIHFSDVQTLEIKDSDYRHKGVRIKNFSLILSDKLCKTHELCISDQEKNILSVYKMICPILVVAESL